MSTVARGNQFEDRVFSALTKEVNAERLGILPKHCTLHLMVSTKFFIVLLWFRSVAAAIQYAM